MIFPNAATLQSLNVNHIPQFFNSAATIPFAYSGAQINYRDSSWLKLAVCESFLNQECPNVDNCSLAHPPNTVKIEAGKVTVCYDYIKKKECKHGNCKYYHPHDALASAILRRGDDTKKNGSSMANLGMTMGLRSPLQMSRSQDLFGLNSQSMLSSHLNNSGIIADPHMQAKLEVMRQINAAGAPQAWLPGLNIASAPLLVQPGNQSNVSLHPLLSGVTSKAPVLNSFGSMLSTAAGSLRITEPDSKASGLKRPSSDTLGPGASSSHLIASNDNTVYGLPDLKKVRSEDSSPNFSASGHYYLPNSMSTAASSMSVTSSLPVQTSSLAGYPQINPLGVNNLLLQSLLAGSPLQPIIGGANSSLETLLALSSQKMFTPINSFQQMPLLQQLYYQQLLQGSLASTPQLLYGPGTVNVAELQQRTLEETSVAFINDKGTILEALPVCKDFLQGKCKRNQACNYVHLLDSNVEIKDSRLTVCKNALKGQCHRPLCKFYHIPAYQLQRLGLHGHGQ